MSGREQSNILPFRYFLKMLWNAFWAVRNVSAVLSETKLCEFQQKLWFQCGKLYITIGQRGKKGIQFSLKGYFEAQSLALTHV